MNKKEITWDDVLECWEETKNGISELLLPSAIMLGIFEEFERGSNKEKELEG